MILTRVKMVHTIEHHTKLFESRITRVAVYDILAVHSTSKSTYSSELAEIS